MSEAITPRLWDVEIQLNPFHTPRVETWDVLEIFGWTEKTLNEMTNGEVINRIHERLRILYNL